MKHKHIWVHLSWYRDELTLKCKKPNCDVTRTRPITKYERKRKIAAAKKELNKYPNIHKIYHEFLKKFKTYKKFKVKSGALKGTYSYAEGWIAKGYDLMLKIEKWANKYPKEVIQLHTDDSYHAGSRLFLITHRMSPRKIWGYSCVSVTQCDGQVPHEFFLYPGDAKELRKALTSISKQKEIF